MRCLLLIVIFAAAYAICDGQSSYRGLTPGKSSRAELERVLGTPQKSISSTLAEYKGGEDATKIYAQFADNSPSAEVLRIELFCEVGPGQRYGCREIFNRLLPEHHSRQSPQVTDAWVYPDDDPQWNLKSILYHGSPAFVVYSYRQNPTVYQMRVALYSPELYDAAVPKGCPGTFAGVWETNRGRMTITRTTEYPRPGQIRIKGALSPNGTVSGIEGSDSLEGEWSDSTGRGTMSLEFNDPRNSIFIGRSFTGTWERTSGKGPRKGTWEGRCVEVKANE